MLNLIQFDDLLDFSFKGRPIIGDDLLWYSKLTYDVVFYKSGHMLGFQYRIGGRFHLLSEVVNCNQNVLVSIRGFRSCSSIHNYALYGERP